MITQRINYAAILKNIKVHVNPEELGVTVGGIRENRSKDLLVEVKCGTRNRGRLDSAFHNVVIETISIHHLLPMVEVEILDIDFTVDVMEVTCLHGQTVVSFLR